MALAIDGTPATGTATGASTVAATITTPTAADIIVAYIFAEWGSAVGANGTVSGVSGGGLTWAKRSSVNGSGTYLAFSSNTSYNNYECWWAYASGTLTAQTITATLTKPGNNNFDGATIMVFGVKGFTGGVFPTSPWDNNGTLPAIATLPNASNPVTVNVSTTATDCMILGAMSQTRSATVGTAGSGYTAVTSVSDNATLNFATTTVEDKVVSTAQTALAVNFDTFSGWQIIADALTQVGSVASAATPSNLPSAASGFIPLAPFVPISLRDAFAWPILPPIPPVPTLAAFFSAGVDPLPRAPFVPVALRDSFTWAIKRPPPGAVLPTTFPFAGFDPLPRAPFVPVALRDAFGWSIILPPIRPITPGPMTNLADGGQPNAPFVPISLRDAFTWSVFPPIPPVPTPSSFPFAGFDPLPRAPFVPVALRDAFGWTVLRVFDPPISSLARIQIPLFVEIPTEDIVTFLNTLITEINQNFSRLGVLDSNLLKFFSVITPDGLTDSVNALIIATNKQLLSLGLPPANVIRRFVFIPLDQMVDGLNLFIIDINAKLRLIFGL